MSVICVICGWLFPAGSGFSRWRWAARSRNGYEVPGLVRSRLVATSLIELLAAAALALVSWVQRHRLRHQVAARSRATDSARATPRGIVLRRSRETSYCPM